MIIYNITVKVDLDIHDDWMTWMTAIHIPEVMQTGCFLQHEIAKVLVDEQDGLTYSIQYRCDSMENLNRYIKDYAPALQQKHTARYKDRFVAFRTLLELL